MKHKIYKNIIIKLIFLIFSISLVLLFSNLKSNNILLHDEKESNTSTISVDNISPKDITYDGFSFSFKVNRGAGELSDGYFIEVDANNAPIWWTKSPINIFDSKQTMKVDQLIEGSILENVSFYLIDNNETKDVVDIYETGQTIEIKHHSGDVTGIKDASIVEGSISESGFSIETHIDYTPALEMNSPYVNPYRVNVIADYYDFENKIIWTSEANNIVNEDGQIYDINGLIPGTTFKNIKIQLTNDDPNPKDIGDPSENLGDQTLEGGDFNDVSEMSDISFDGITLSSFTVHVTTIEKGTGVNPYRVKVFGQVGDEELVFSSEIFNNSGEISFEIKGLTPETTYSNIGLQLWSYNKQDWISLKTETEKSITTLKVEEPSSVGLIVGVTAIVLTIVVSGIGLTIYMFKKKEDII